MTALGQNKLPLTSDSLRSSPASFSPFQPNGALGVVDMRDVQALFVLAAIPARNGPRRALVQA